MLWKSRLACCPCRELGVNCTSMRCLACFAGTSGCFKHAEVKPADSQCSTESYSQGPRFADQHVKGKGGHCEPAHSAEARSTPTAAYSVTTAAVPTHAALGQRTTGSEHSMLQYTNLPKQWTPDLQQNFSSPASRKFDAVQPDAGRARSAAQTCESTAEPTLNALPEPASIREQLAHTLERLALTHPPPLFAGRYILSTEQKHGGQSIVQFARDHQDGMKQYAVKCAPLCVVRWQACSASAQ